MAKGIDFVKAVERECDGLTGLNVGASAVCPTCLDLYGIEDTGDTDAMQEQLNEFDSPSFSREACDTCGSGLGGDRYCAHGFMKDGNLIHLDVCVDCVMYFANGDVPDQWGD